MLSLARRWMIFSVWFVVAYGIDDPAIPAGLFYPFGPDEGDSILPNRTGSYSEVQLARTVAFRTEHYGKIFVSNKVFVGHKVCE
jgi:hypothetical protein